MAVEFKLFDNQERANWKTHLLAQRKLVLLVDLDSTLVRNFKTTRLEPTFIAFKRPFLIRPRCKEFLQALDPYYELVVATKARRMYAENFLDRVGVNQLFGGRILSGEMCQIDKISFLPHLTPVDESMIVAIDDKRREWRQKPYAIEVKLYDPEKDNDQLKYIENGSPVSKLYLDFLTELLKQISIEFYEQHDQENEVPTEDILSKNIKSKVLNKCNIWLNNFRGDHRFIQLIGELGASIYNPAGKEPPTHIVARSKGAISKEVLEKFSDVKIVSREWIFKSAKFWVQLDEQQFFLS